MSDVEIVRKAADYIERVGLHQGMYWDERVDFKVDEDADTIEIARAAVRRGVKCCTIGALIGNGGEWELEGKLGAFYKTRSLPWPTDFNDVRGRTADEVVAELRAFADHLEQTTEVQP
jgi:hypothetical protein